MTVTAINNKKRTITLTMPPLHPYQEKVYKSNARFKTLSCGRRWGKTSLAYVLAVECAIKGGRVWWIAPTTTIAKIGWRLVKQNVQKILEYKHETDLYMLFPGGGEIWFKSADSPDGLRGESLDLAIFDEAAFVKENVWEMIVRPMLADRLGKAVFISTPNGTGNYFFDLFMLGQNKDEVDAGNYESWKFPSSTNPHLPIQEFEDAKRRLPKLIFEQEWMGEFTSDGSSVFKGIDRICVGARKLPRPDTYYVAGLDWGIKNDFTVISIFDAIRREQVELKWTNKTTFTEQYSMIREVCEAYGVVKLLVEENAIGIAPLEELRKLGLPVYPFQTTNQSKQDIVINLVHMMDMDKITLLDEPKLKSEMKIYEATRLPLGGWRYAAAGKGHDDTVMATMLAASLLTFGDAYAPAKFVKVVAVNSPNKKKERGPFFISNGYPN